MIVRTGAICLRRLGRLAIEMLVDGMEKTSFRSLKEPPGVGPPLIT